MHNDNVDDKRNSIRQKVDTKVDDSEGTQNRGSLLKDLPTRGSAIEYVHGTALVDGPLLIGEVVHLDIRSTAFPSCIVGRLITGLQCNLIGLCTSLMCVNQKIVFLFVFHNDS